MTAPATLDAQLALWGKRKPLALRYLEWRTSEEGMELARAIERYALDQLAAGATRISVNQLFEGLRTTRHASLDNSFRAPLARALVEKHPQLRGVIRVRKAATDA